MPLDDSQWNRWFNGASRTTEPKYFEMICLDTHSNVWLFSLNCKLNHLHWSQQHKWLQNLYFLWLLHFPYLVSVFHNDTTTGQHIILIFSQLCLSDYLQELSIHTTYSNVNLYPRFTEPPLLTCYQQYTFCRTADQGETLKWPKIS